MPDGSRAGSAWWEGMEEEDCSAPDRQEAEKLGLRDKDTASQVRPLVTHLQSARSVVNSLISGLTHS